jgi:hypothetical protein
MAVNRQARLSLLSPGRTRMTVMMLRLQLVSLIAVSVFTASISAQNPDIAALQHKAEAGDAKAEFELANSYIEKDPAKAVEWLRRSASRGYAGAQVVLGYMYQTGQVKEVQRNPHEAAKWYRKAASQRGNNANDAKNAQTAQAHLSELLAQRLISKQEADWRASETASVADKEAKKNKAQPFSLSEVETGITGGITNKRMATLVNTYGVDFALNTRAEKQLRDDGADDDLLKTVAASKR